MSSRLNLLAILLLCGACAPKIGPSHPWIAADQIEGTYRPEISASPTDAPRPFAPEEMLRVTTFNLHQGEDVPAIAQALQENGALARTDVFLFQEIRSYVSEGSSRTKRLADRLGMAYVYAPAKEVEGGSHGLAILSRFPLENIAVMELPEGKLLINDERRIAVAAEIQFGTRLRLINVHLDTRLNATERVLQLRPAVLESPAGSVVAGDFNTNPLTWGFNAIPLLPLAPGGGTDQAAVIDDYMRTIGMATPTSRLGPTVSFPIMEPRLDSIYLRGLESGAGAVERDVTVSDHWPLWLDVRVGES